MPEIESWKQIKDFEGLYEISNFGRVRALERFYVDSKNRNQRKRERYLKLSLDGKGYLQCRLSKNSIMYGFKIHHLVWDHFGNQKRNGLKLQIDHKDHNKQNNSINNLQLLTNRQNVNKAFTQKITSSAFEGVHFDKVNNKYRAVIRISSKSISLGRFINEVDAALAYQRAKLMYRVI